MSPLTLLVLAPLAAQLPEIHWARSTVSGHWHGFTPATTTWANGEALAQSYGGHLATIRDAAESAWFGATIDAIPGAEPVWIGLNDVAVEGSFVWASGEPVTYTSWESGQPDHATPEHDVVEARGFATGSAWRNVPVSYGGNRPAIERLANPESGWRLPSVTALPFYNPGRPSLGDMDGDGRLDVVVPQRAFPTGGFAILHGLPGGGFSPPQVVTSTSDGTHSAVADFDLDGRLDVLLAGGASFAVHLAGPSLDYAQTWTAAASAPVQDVAVGDVDADGRPDVFLATNTSLRIYRTVSGGFATPIVYPISVARGVAVGDVDGDGVLDWVASEASLVHVYLNDGTGAASSTSTAPVDSIASAMTIADFDGDSHADLAVASSFTAAVRVLWGDGAGNFDASGPLVLGVASPYSVGTADFDRDGRPDLCVSSIGYDVVAVALSMGPNGFAPQSTLFADDVPRGVATGDLDGDGRPEIVSTVNPGQIVVQERFATDCDLDGVDDTSQIRDDPSLDLDGDLRLDACEIPGSAACLGDGSGAACPCGNSSASSEHAGCANSTGLGGRLAATGNASVANDSVTLHASGLTAGAALFFQGTQLVAGGAGTAFGDGLRCAGGAVLRLGIRMPASGAAQLGSAAGDPSLASLGQLPASGGSRAYQAWYRNAASFCTSSTFNLTNAWTLDWTP